MHRINIRAELMCLNFVKEDDKFEHTECDRYATACITNQAADLCSDTKLVCRLSDDFQM